MAKGSNKARTRSLHEDAYRDFVRLLVAERKATKLTQEDVADALGWNQSIVAKVEKAERRLDIVEFIRMARIIGFDPSAMVKHVEENILSGEE